jgi:hypothetical protein
LSCWRRLQVRWDRDAGRWFAFVLVACAVVCEDVLSSVELRWRPGTDQAASSLL